MPLIRTRSVTPVGGRITINRTIGIQTPPRTKKKLRCRPSSELQAVKPELPNLLPQPALASKESRRRSSAEEMPRRERAKPPSASAGRSPLSSRRLIKRKTRELKAQRRRDKYRELFLRQQALALERLAQVSATTDPGSNQEAAEEDQEECEGQVEEIDRQSRRTKNKKQIKKELKAVGEDRGEPNIENQSLEGKEGEYLATLSDLLDSSSESEQPNAGIRLNPATEQLRQVHYSPSEAGDSEGCEYQMTDSNVCSRDLSFVSIEVNPNETAVATTESYTGDAVCESETVDKETEVVVPTAQRPRAVRRKSSTQSGRQPRIILNLAEKAYAARILVADPKHPTKKQPVPSTSCKFSELDRDERDLVQILKEAQPLAAARRDNVDMRKQRRGEPTFEEPDRSVWTGGPGAQLTEMLSKMRRRSRIAQRRAAFLCRRVNVLSKNCYWTPAEDGGKESPAKKPYATFILAADQIRSFF
jgi:hypothetical protein